MTHSVTQPAVPSKGLTQGASRLALIAIAALSVTACRPNDAFGPDKPQVAGWSLIDHAQRHPILVSQEPVTMSLPVRAGSYGLTNKSRARVGRFLRKFQATDVGNSRLVIAVPSGGANEVAAMQVVAEVREMISEAGFPASSVHVDAYNGRGGVKLSYLRVVAKGPECGLWPSNLANEVANLPYPNFGCATQANFAAQLANPADLLGPRTETARDGARRDYVWGKYTKGETTSAQKSGDEKINTQKSE